MTCENSRGFLGVCWGFHAEFSENSRAIFRTRWVASSRAITWQQVTHALQRSFASRSSHHGMLGQEVPTIDLMAGKKVVHEGT